MADGLVDRFRAAFKALLAEELPNIKYLSQHRYAVTDCDYDAQTFGGQPSVSKYGLPAVEKVPIRSPYQVELKPGTSVMLGFESGDPAAPYLANLDQLVLFGKAKIRADGNIEIGETAKQAAGRQGDMVIMPSLGLTIMFAVSPAGDTGLPPPTAMMTNVPYFVSLSTVAAPPPAFPPTGSWAAVISTGSALVKVA